MSEATDDRIAARPPRTNLFLGATLTLPGQLPREVRVRNLSASGARIDLADPPASGSTLLLRRGSAKAAGTVVWSGAGNCGLRFTETIDVEAWISDRPAAAPAKLAGAQTLADDLALVRLLLERLEGGLADQPVVVEAIGPELQALDLAGQLLRLAEQKAGGGPAPGRRGVRQAAETFLRQPPEAA